MKTCSVCKIKKELFEFYKRKLSRNGYRSECKSCDKIYRIKNVEHKKQYNDKYYKKNANIICENANQYYKDNAEHIKQQIKKYRKTPEGKLLRKASEYKRRARLKGNTPVAKDWKPEDIKLKFKLQHGKCVYCETSIKDYYEIDHIIPVSKGGSNEPSNIQLLCKSCNGTGGKGSKLPHEFAKKHGKLF